MTSDNKENAVRISNFHEIPPLGAGKPKRIMILLHGYGANGDDMADIAFVLRNFMTDCLFITPDAPFDCVVSDEGKQWFSLKDWNSRDMMVEANKVIPILQSFIDEQSEKHDLPAESIFIGGFSQGAALSLLMSMKSNKNLAGVLAYSGWLLDERIFKNNSESLSKSPIFLAHGDQDEVVPFSMWQKAKEILDENGFDAEYNVQQNLAHTISMDSLIKGAEFANKISNS